MKWWKPSRELQQSSAHLLIPSLFGAQAEAICWQLSHPPVFPLAHTWISFFPKIWGKSLFTFLKATKNEKKNKPSVVPRSCLHALPWLQFHLWCKCWQCQNSSAQWFNKRGKLGHSVPCPILTLHNYCLYLQFHSYIPAVLPIQRLLSQMSRLRLQQSWPSAALGRQGGSALALFPGKWWQRRKHYNGSMHQNTQQDFSTGCYFSMWSRTRDIFYKNTN